MLDRSHPLRPTPQLRAALDQLPRTDGAPEVHVTVHVPPATPSSTGELDVDFHRAMLTTEDGQEHPVWVFEGPVRIDPEYVTASGTREYLGQWLREQLGPRCLDVSIQDVRGSTAIVRVVASNREVRGKA